MGRRSFVVRLRAPAAGISTSRELVVKLPPARESNHIPPGRLVKGFAGYLSPSGRSRSREARPAGRPPSGEAHLGDATPKDQTRALVKRFWPAAVIRAMAAYLPANDAKEEYRRIPWIWRVAIAAGRVNDAKVVGALIEVSLPKKSEALRDWQAVVLGGGVINGISLEGKWPGKRLAELIRDNPELERRWAETVKLSHAMADAEKVPTGTRYDALRIVALDEWKRAEPRLIPYLAKTANAELQQGAVSGLVDVDDAGATAVLVKALPDLTAGNRKFAIAGLLRTPERATALLEALEKGPAKQEWLEKEEREGLLKHADEAVRVRAAKVLGK